MAKVKLDSLGMQRLLNDKGVREELERVGNQLANSAGGADYDVQQWYERKVAVVNVRDLRKGAIGIEAAEGNLARAVTRMTK